MGAEAWHYFTPYRGGVQPSLDELRYQEFAARRFYHSERPSTAIDEAIENAGETGTRSILDIEFVTDAPEVHGACPVPPEVMREVFGSEPPTREAVQRAFEINEAFEDFFVEVPRGGACYIVVYRESKPSEVFFAGWSGD
jgi:hypothetical protein